MQVRGQAQSLEKGAGDRLVRRVPIFADRYRDPSGGQLGQLLVSIGYRTRQPDQRRDDQSVALARCGQRLSQGRTRTGHPCQARVEVHPVRIDSQRQQRCPLLGGVRAEPRHLGVADHQRDHLDSLSDKPPVRESAPNTPYATLSPTHAV